MRTFFIILLSLIAGAFAGYQYWAHLPESVDPVQVIVSQMKTHAVIQHERQIAVWYRACPKVWGQSPQIFLAWPAQLTYQIELGDIEVSRSGTAITVRTSAIHPVDPSVPTDRIESLFTSPVLSYFADKQQLLNVEISKATPLARYLSTYFLAHDASLQEDFREEVQSLVEHFTASLGVPVTRVDVEIPKVEVESWPQLPKIELCPGSRADVNGLAFAKFEDEKVAPIGFKIPQRHIAEPDGAPPASAPKAPAPRAPSPSAPAPAPASSATPTAAGAR